MQGESQFLGISVRGWLAIMITATLCTTTLMTIQVNEPFKSIAVVVLGFYFGQKQKEKENGN